MLRLLALGGLIGAAAVAATDVQAQTDLSAGMSPAQLFAANCAACHRSPRGLARGRDPARLAYFLRDHYTTRPGIAAALAGYLAGNSGPEPRPAPQAPAAGGQTAPAVPVARTRPLERLANPTVDRLKSFATDADPAKPSGPDAPDAPERGATLIQSYSASGAAADALRDAAAAAAIQEGRSGAPEQGLRPTRGDPSTPPNSDAAEAAKGAGASGGAAAASASGTPGAAQPPQGPPPRDATPSSQSNDDKP